MVSNGREQVALTAQKVTLQMLGVEVGLRAVRAWELAIRIFLRDLVLVDRSGSWGSRSARGTGKNAAAALRTDHVGGLLVIREHGLGHQWALSVGRGHALLGHDAASRHRPQDRGTPCAGCRSRGDGLRVSHSGRGLRKHSGGRSRVALVGLLVVTGHHLVGAATTISVRRRGVVVHGGARGVWGSRRARRVGVAPVRSPGLHNTVALLLVVVLVRVLLVLVLEWRKSMGLEILGS